MAQNIEGESPVCKLNQTGYCRYKEACPKTHNNNLYSEKVCRRIDCRERHPRHVDIFHRTKYAD